MKNAFLVRLMALSLVAGSFSNSHTALAQDSVQADRSGQQQKPPMSPEKIEKYADQQARTVANRVVKTYGEAERFRYQFEVGFWTTFGSFKRRDFRGADYSEGKDNGYNAGERDGRNAGDQSASAAASNQARSDAISRFAAVVDSGKNADTTVRVPNFSYNGTTGGKGEPDLSDFLRQIDQELKARMTSLRWGEGEYSIGYNDYIGSRSWSVSSVYRGSSYDSYSGFKFLDSWFRQENAFSEWQNNNLDGAYDKNLYNKMTESERYSFMVEFKRVYQSVIDEKLEKTITKPHSYAREWGEGYGVRAGEKFAALKGYNEGYNQGHIAGSRRSFEASVSGYYSQAFNNQVDHLEANPYISEFKTRLVDSNRDGVFELGESVDVEIVRLVNIGMKPAVLSTATLQGAALTGGNTDRVEVQVAASSSVKEARVLKNMAKVSETAEADKELVAQFRLGELTSNVSFEVSLNKVIEVVNGIDSSDPRYAKFADYVVNNVRAEYSAALNNKINPFGKDNKARTTLEKMTDAAKGRPAVGTFMKSIQPRLLSIHEEVKGPGSWSSTNRATKKQYLAIVNAI